MALLSVCSTIICSRYILFFHPSLFRPSLLRWTLNIFICAYLIESMRVFFKIILLHFSVSIIVNIIFILFDQRHQKLRQKSKCFCATHFKACSLFAPILKLKMKYYLPKYVYLLNTTQYQLNTHDQQEK